MARQARQAVALGTSYSFGDTTVAQERLDLLAAVFDPPSRAFLRDMVTRPPTLAYDLGCGPGNTTRMVRDATGARRVIGLDSSAAFIQSASERSGADKFGKDEFRVWDAADPLPVAEPDLVYARMLLAHLAGPASLAAAWAGQLAPGGLLLLDEVERINTGNEVFTDYLTVVAARVRAAGAEMYAGPLLGAIPLGEESRVISSQVVAHPVPAGRAARLFRLNLSVWGDDPWVTARFGPDTTARLDRGLSRVRHGEITWRIRQVAIRRDGP